MTLLRLKGRAQLAQGSGHAFQNGFHGVSGLAAREAAGCPGCL